jgi:hypothetical protein
MSVFRRVIIKLSRSLTASPSPLPNDIKPYLTVMIGQSRRTLGKKLTRLTNRTPVWTEDGDSVNEIAKGGINVKDASPAAKLKSRQKRTIAGPIP